MQLVDTHCHLDFPDYKDDLDEVIKRALQAGVVRMVLPGTSIQSSREVIDLSAKYPQVYAACGIHPHEADKVTDKDIETLRKMATSDGKVVAIGEIGLDYYKGYSKPENQKSLLTECVKIARELDFPVILHSRNAEEDILKFIDGGSFNTLRGVFHCFSGDEAFLEKVLALDFFVSFAGNITFEKAEDSRKLAKKVPLEKLLLETDSPYITPVPNRGKRNEPAYVRFLLNSYAEVYGMQPEEVADITTRNADRLFRLGIEKKDTITYQIRNSLYLNVTYRCTNRCTFCTREVSDYVKGYDLKLDKEPSYDEIIEAIGDVSRYEEIVFCGFGEPTLRLDMLKRVASYVKEKGGTVRLTTNGEGNLINGRVIAPELRGLVDRVSISLNAPNSEEYDHICRSVFGSVAYETVLGFISECKKEGIEVEVTCLDILSEEGLAKCKEIAGSMGASFRLRHLHAVG